MTRSDGSFPSYKKIAYSKDTPEDYYSNDALRCGVCEKLWPNYKEFQPESPCCGAPMILAKNKSPDMTWPVAVKALIYHKFERFYEKWNEDATDAELEWGETGKVVVSEKDVAEGMQEIDRIIESGGNASRRTEYDL
jgi:hypothetical protein